MLKMLHSIESLYKKSMIQESIYMKLHEVQNNNIMLHMSFFNVCAIASIHFTIYIIHG